MHICSILYWFLLALYSKFLILYLFLIEITFYWIVILFCIRVFIAAPASGPDPSTEITGNLSSVDDFVVEADNDLGFLNSVEESYVEPGNVSEQPYEHDSDR